MASLPIMLHSPRASDTGVALGAGLALLVSYWYTAPRTVVLEDDGYFLQAAWYAAAAHPPGYPLYVALSHLATLIPVGSVALRVHALTGLMAAAAAVLLFLLARRFGLSRSAAAGAALVLGWSEAFWSQAIIAEVYALNVLLFLACAHMALGFARDPGAVAPRALAAAGLLYGLGLANHWPLLVLSTPALLALAWPAWRPILRGAGPLALGVAAGLLPYAWMIWRTHVVPEYSFAGPITSWQEFRFYVAREGYAGMDRSVSAGWQDRLQYAGYVVQQLRHQFGWPGAALALVGLVRMGRRWPWPARVFSVLGFLGSTLLLIGLLRFDYDELHRSLFRVYPLIAYAMVALWIGLGLDGCAARCESRWGRRVTPGVIGAVAAVALAGGAWLAHFPGNDRRGDRWAENYARVVLESLPEGARFYSNSDTSDGPVAYQHRVLGLRPDIMFITGTSLSLDGELFRPYALSRADLEALLVRYIRAEPRPVFYTNGFPQPFAQVDYGLYFGVDTEASPASYRAQTAPPIQAFFAGLDAVAPPADTWESMHFRRVRADQCRWLVALAGAVPPRNPADLPPACRGLHGRLWLARHFRAGGDAGAGRVLELLPGDPGLLRQAITRSELNDFLALQRWARDVLAQNPGLRRGEEM